MKSTNNNSMELEKSQTNVNQMNNTELNSQSENDKQLYQNIPIENTPFNAIKTGEKWFLTLGKYRISQEFETLKEVQEDALNTDWIRIMTIMNVLIMNREEELKIQNIEINE